MIPLTTERLRLRALSDDDLVFVRELHANPDLLRLIPSAATPDEQTAQDRLARFMSLSGHPVQGFSLVELRETGEPVGLILVKPIPPSRGGAPSVLEIGWRQAAAHCGNGYVTEAAGAVLEAVHARGVDDVVAVVAPDNLASQGVAVRIGMEHIGLTRDYYNRDTECVLFRSHRDRASGAVRLPRGWELVEVGEYGFPGPLRDRLVAAILSGRKRTTTALLEDYEAGGESLPEPGAREVVIDSAGDPVCVTEIVAVDVLRLAEVPLEHALAEGEGYRSVTEWRQGHEDFWTGSEYRDWFTVQGVQPPRIADDTLAVLTRFTVVAQDPERGTGGHR